MNKRPLCIAEACYSRGQHRDDCNTEDCRGCIPRVAMSDAYLCEGCIRQLARNIAELPRLHQALMQAMVGGSGNAERSSNKPGSKVPNPGAMDARHEIRAHLVAWARAIIEDRDIEPPADTIEALAAFVGRHVPWLAGQLYADEAVSQFADVAGKARPIAYPDKTPRIHVGGCVKPDCRGRLWMKARQAAKVTCDEDHDHQWDTTQWRRLSRQLKAAA